MPKARGTQFARYLRQVHVEWCPFKPKALAPIFFQELHSKPVMDAVPKLSITKSLFTTRSPTDAAPSYVDRTHITFADGVKKTFDFSMVEKLSDVMEEIDMENVRIQGEERARGKPFS